MPECLKPYDLTKAPIWEPNPNRSNSEMKIAHTAYRLLTFLHLHFWARRVWGWGWVVVGYRDIMKEIIYPPVSLRLWQGIERHPCLSVTENWSEEVLS